MHRAALKKRGAAPVSGLFRQRAGSFMRSGVSKLFSTLSTELSTEKAAGKAVFPAFLPNRVDKFQKSGSFPQPFSGFSF